MKPGPRRHDEIEELIAADVLDGLDGPEHDRLVLELARHGPDCPECRRLILQYAELAGQLALSLNPVPSAGGAEERLVRAARAEGSGGSRPPSGGPGPREQPARRAAPGRVARWLAGAAAAAAIAVIGGVVGYSISPRTPAEQTRAIAFVAEPGTRVVGFPAPRGERLAVAFRQGEQRGWIIGTNLPPPAGNRVYELWFREAGTARMHPAGTFLPHGGTVAAPASLEGPFTALAVSVEPRGGSRQPTTPPIFIAPVSL